MKSVSWNWRRKYFDETFHSVYILCVHSCVIWNIVHKNKEYILVHRQLWYWFSIKDWSGEHVTCACFEETVRRHWVHWVHPPILPAWEESTVAVIRILNWGLSAPRSKLKLPGTFFVESLNLFVKISVRGKSIIEKKELSMKYHSWISPFKNVLNRKH